MDNIWEFIIKFFQFLLIPGLSPLVVGVIRKIKARLQNRQGASLWQPYFDLWKLFHKDEVISEDASFLFRFSPYLLFAITLVLGGMLPIITSKSIFGALGDFLVVIYLLALFTFFLALSGMDAASPFGGFGSSREMTLAALTEAGLIFSLIPLVLATNQTELSKIIEFSFMGGAVIVIAFFGFFIALLSGNSRYPFDNPATHLELTMVHEAMILEYSGKRLALMEWSSWNKLLIFMALGANLFFPLGIAYGFGFFSLVIGLLVILIKLGILASVIAVIESSIAKLRLFLLPNLLFASFILGVIAIILTTL